MQLRHMPDKPLTPDEIERNRNALRHIKPWLKYRRLTQRQLADRLGMSEPAVSKWLRGIQGMSVAQFMQIASILEASPDELLFAPPEAQKATRYRKAAEIAHDLDESELEAWIAVGNAMRKKV